MAKDFLADQKVRAEIGEITRKRLGTIDSAIHCQLNPYVGKVQINHLGQDRWGGYPVWRRLDARKRKAVEDERQARLEEAEEKNDKREVAKLRAQAPKDRKGRVRLLTGVVSDASIRTEMSIFRSIMAFAAGKKFISESQVFKGKLPLAKVRSEEFTQEEYRHLHTYARKWVKAAPSAFARWYRQIAYNFILDMISQSAGPVQFLAQAGPLATGINMCCAL